jgi:hypothetical protein
VLAKPDIYVQVWKTFSLTTTLTGDYVPVGSSLVDGSLLMTNTVQKLACSLATTVIPYHSFLDRFIFQA